MEQLLNNTKAQYANENEMLMFEPMHLFIPETLWDELMYMGNKDMVRIYKHIDTRRCINVDDLGLFYKYNRDYEDYIKISYDEAMKHLLS